VLARTSGRKHRSVHISGDFDRKNLLKTKKSLYVDIASRADSGQWQFMSAKILLSTERA
jgi:hypothetical protein